VAGSCKCGNELSSSINGGEFIGILNDEQILKKDCTPWSQSASQSISQSVG
jgi:hypothetical protein